MCNGLNHRRDCKCGWGHDGYLSYESGYVSAAVKSVAENFLESRKTNITVPNFHCFCGKKVFFFQDSNGGRVLFEALGHPWPKHFCLGRQYQKKKLNLNISPDKWIQLGHFKVTPSSDVSSYSVRGMVHDVEVDIKVSFAELLLVRDIYLTSAGFKERSTALEILVVYEDGNYSFESALLTSARPFRMREVELSRSSGIQKNLFN